MELPEIRKVPHRRFNPLTREWVLVSPQRTQRPWRGQLEKAAAPVGLAYDPNCYLCPGNARAGAARNSQYTGSFVFENDFAALQPDTPHGNVNQCERGLIVAETERGLCKVLCFSPRHDLTLARMRAEDVVAIVNLWAEEYTKIGALPYINYVQIFENRGEMMGCSNPHPHCQIWANETIPNEPLKEQLCQAEYQVRNGKCLLCDYADFETSSAERLVDQNDHFMAVVPFWATWPFEILLLSNQHIPDIASMNAAQRSSFAEILKRLTVRYENLFETPFPYSMGLHQRPSDGLEHAEWHFHAHFYPPLLRSGSVRKFMVGYEMMASPQRDITPESAAEKLRSVSRVHYLDTL